VNTRAYFTPIVVASHCLNRRSALKIWSTWDAGVHLRPERIKFAGAILGATASNEISFCSRAQSLRVHFRFLPGHLISVRRRLKPQ